LGQYPARWRSFIAAVSLPSLRSGTIGLIALVCASLLGSEVWQLWRVYEGNIQQTEVANANIARSMATQADAAITTADTIVATLVEQVEAEGTGPEARTRLYALMTSLAAALPAIHEMGIMDSRGTAIVKSLVKDPSGLNYAEREYFRYHATHPERGPFIGARIKSKIDGTYAITATRRFNHPDGSFAGVIVTSVSMVYFQQLFDQMQAKSGGIIALIADDDTILVRSPPLPGGIEGAGGKSGLNQKMRGSLHAGNLTYVSGFDGVRRLGAYQHLDRYPLATLVAQSEWDVQRSWRAELRSHAVILACVMIVVVVLGGHVVRANRMLTSQAMHDGLTGLANRRCFDATLDHEFRRVARSGQAISIIMIDLDQFKDYNDCYGHLAGDECLRVIARAIQGCLRRAGEFAARYGGEEIAVVLPGVDEQRACVLAETMRSAIHDLALPHSRSARGIVTLSAGVATASPGQDDDGWRALIGDADAALYAAKQRGRNTVAACSASVMPHSSVGSTARSPERQAA
jgi:diguanylate cyclase (GGDEF)-like protein